MADEIIGIAVLDLSDDPQELHVLCRCADGQSRPTTIPVYAKGTPKVLTNQWEYVARGEFLDVTPSLNWQGVFHNAGAWSVLFKVFDPAQYRKAGDQFRAANGIQK